MENRKELLTCQLNSNKISFYNRAGAICFLYALLEMTYLKLSICVGRSMKNLVRPHTDQYEISFYWTKWKMERNQVVVQDEWLSVEKW
jgi:CRISPR/Cas system-associated protein Cas10 (large subunit of type III CRISPR-Cas system)